MFLLVLFVWGCFVLLGFFDFCFCRDTKFLTVFRMYSSRCSDLCGISRAVGLRTLGIFFSWSIVAAVMGPTEWAKVPHPTDVTPPQSSEKIQPAQNEKEAGGCF